MLKFVVVGRLSLAKTTQIRVPVACLNLQRAAAGRCLTEVNGRNLDLEIHVEFADAGNLGPSTAGRPREPALSPHEPAATEGDQTLTSSNDHVGTGALARPAERSSTTNLCGASLALRLRSVETPSTCGASLRWAGGAHVST